MNKILIIWDGASNLNEWRLQCVTQINNIYPNADLTCITKNKNSLPEFVYSFESWEYYEKVAWDKYYVRGDGPQYLSDYFRFIYLANNPRTLYLDTDMLLHKPIPETKEMARWCGDISAIWNGDENEFFHWALYNRFGNDLRSLQRCFPQKTLLLNEYMQHKQFKKKGKPCIK